MDELLRDFLTESGEHIEGAEQQILQFEQNPTDAGLVASIFRLVHTIKGTAGFLGLERLQAVAHAAETAIGRLRDGAAPTARGMSLILVAIDRIKLLLSEIEQLEREPLGDDSDIIGPLEKCSEEQVIANLVSGERQGDAPELSEARSSTENNQSSKARTKRKGAIAKKSSPIHALEDHNPIHDQSTSTSTSLNVAITGDVASKEAQVSQAAAAVEQRTPSRSSPNDGKNRSADTIRVTVSTIENIMQLVSELVLTRNQLLELTRRHESEVMKGPLQRLSSLTTDLQDAVMRARMQPVGRLYGSLPRMVRELATELGKKISIVTDGADTEIDRQLIEVIRDPLTHLIRNCADHGIEFPSERRAAGKPEVGEVRVSAAHQAGYITITIVDDGKGIDAAKVGAKAVANGLVSAEQLSQMTTEEIYAFIFEPGLSTAAALSNVSGRGVGMDVVRSNIESIGGAVTVTSQPGQGTTFALKIPLTLAIAPALIIEVATQRFALPQHSVMEVVGLGPGGNHLLERVQNALILKLRDEVLPAVELNGVLDLENSQRSERLAVIVKVGMTPFAIIVDDVLDVQEIVVKPLSGSLGHLRVFSGRTILGDGTVVLILDASGLASRIGIEDNGSRKGEASKVVPPEARSMRMVLFRAGTGVTKAIPLSAVSRIESVAAGDLNFVDGQLVMLRNGHLMPVVPLSGAADPMTRDVHALFVIGQENQAVGLLVDSIEDIVEEVLTLKIEGTSPDCIGGTEIRGAPVEIIDVAYYLASLGFGERRSRQRGDLIVVSADEFFFDTVAPILRAAGYSVTCLTPLRLASKAMQATVRSDAIILDLDVSASEIGSWSEPLRTLGGTAANLIGLYAHGLPEVVQVLGVPTSQCRRKSDRLGFLELVSRLVESRSGVGAYQADGGSDEMAA